jgi:quercetin dioxygenase-like cupin family protein
MHRRCHVSKLIGVLVSTFLLFSPLALAEAPAPEAAVAFALDDQRLQWGPCPAFIPKGCEIAVLHGDPGQPNADIFFKVPGNFTIPHHWHTSVERIVLVSGELHVTYDGHETTVLRTGMYAYGPAKLPHKAFCAEGAPCVLFIAFEGPLDAVPVEGSSE